MEHDVRALIVVHLREELLAVVAAGTPLAEPDLVHKRPPAIRRRHRLDEGEQAGHLLLAGPVCLASFLATLHRRSDCAGGVRRAGRNKLIAATQARSERMRLQVATLSWSSGSGGDQPILHCWLSAADRVEGVGAVVALWPVAVVDHVLVEAALN